jgi:putative addiction module component (TIGR02574 family)
VSPKADELLKEALSLSESERAELAGLLLRSLEPPPEADVEEAWREEVGNRVAAIDSGEAEMIPWSVVRDRLFARLSERRRG